MVQKNQNVETEYEANKAAVESFLRAAFYVGVGLGVLAGKALADFLKENQ